MAFVQMDDKPVDLLRRVWIYNGKKYQTQDGTYYARDEKGAVHRQIPKVRGKAARRADKLARRKVNHAASS